MKVILLKDVAKIGRKYEVKNVADGHAVNFLIPHGLAEIANEGNVKKVETRKAAEVENQKVQEDLILKNIKDLDGVEITATEKANDKGHLFAGIHKEELILLIKQQTHLDVLPSHINLEKPIKEVGEHEIEVQIRDTKVMFKLVVTAK